jgi:hypothetical protein
MSAKPPNSRPSSAIRQSPKSKRELSAGPETKELVSKARDVGTKISQDENKTRQLLRALYNAEKCANNPSIKESLVQFYLRTKVHIYCIHTFSTSGF